MTDTPSSNLFSTIIRGITVPVEDLHSYTHVRVCVKVLNQIVKSKKENNCERRVAAAESIWIPWLVEVIKRFNNNNEAAHNESQNLLWSTVSKYTPFVCGDRPSCCSVITEKMNVHEENMLLELPKGINSRFNLCIWSISARYNTAILSPTSSQKTINKLLGAMSVYLSRSDPLPLADGLLCLTQLLGSWTSYTRKTRISNIITVPVVKERSRVWNISKNTSESCSAGLFVWQQLLERSLYMNSSISTSEIDDFMRQAVSDYLSLFYSNTSESFIKLSAIFTSAFNLIATVLPHGCSLAKVLLSNEVFSVDKSIHVSLVDGYIRPTLPLSVVQFVFDSCKISFCDSLPTATVNDRYLEPLFIIIVFLGAQLALLDESLSLSISTQVMNIFLSFCKITTHDVIKRCLTTILSLQSSCYTTSLHGIDSENFSGAPGLSRSKALLLISYNNRCSHPCENNILFEQCVDLLTVGKPSNKLQNLLWISKTLLNPEFGHDITCKVGFELATIKATATLLSAKNVSDDSIQNVMKSILSKTRNWEPLLTVVLNASSRPYQAGVTEVLAPIVKKMLFILNEYYRGIQNHQPGSPVFDNPIVSTWQCSNKPSTAVLQLLTWENSSFIAESNPTVVMMLVEWIIQQSSVKPDYYIPDVEAAVLQPKTRHDVIFLLSNVTYMKGTSIISLTSVVLSLIKNSSNEDHLLRLFDILLLLFHWCVSKSGGQLIDSETELKFLLAMFAINTSTEMLFDKLLDCKVKKKKKLYEKLQNVFSSITSMLASKQSPLVRWITCCCSSIGFDKRSAKSALVFDVTDISTPHGKVQLSVTLTSDFLTRILTFKSAFILELGFQLWQSTFGILSSQSIRFPPELIAALRSARRSGITVTIPEVSGSQELDCYEQNNLVNINDIAETQERRSTPPEPTAVIGIARVSKSRFLTPQRKAPREETINLPKHRPRITLPDPVEVIDSKRVSFSSINSNSIIALVSDQGEEVNKETLKDRSTSDSASHQEQIPKKEVSDCSKAQVIEIDSQSQSEDELNENQQKETTVKKQSPPKDTLPDSRQIDFAITTSSSPQFRRSVGCTSESTVETPEVRETNESIKTPHQIIPTPDICNNKIESIDGIKVLQHSNEVLPEVATDVLKHENDQTNLLTGDDKTEQQNEDIEDSPPSLQIITREGDSSSRSVSPALLQTEMVGTTQFEKFFAEESNSDYPNEPSQDITATRIVKEGVTAPDFSDRPALVGTSQFECLSSLEEVPTADKSIEQSTPAEVQKPQSQVTPVEDNTTTHERGLQSDELKIEQKDNKQEIIPTDPTPKTESSQLKSQPNNQIKEGKQSIRCSQITSQKTDKSAGCSSSGALPESPPAVKGQQLQLRPPFSGEDKCCVGIDQFTIDVGGQTPMKKSTKATNSNDINLLTIVTDDVIAPPSTGGIKKIQSTPPNIEQLTIAVTNQTEQLNKQVDTTTTTTTTTTSNDNDLTVVMVSEQQQSATVISNNEEQLPLPQNSQTVVSIKTTVDKEHQKESPHNKDQTSDKHLKESVQQSPECTETEVPQQIVDTTNSESIVIKTNCTSSPVDIIDSDGNEQTKRLIELNNQSTEVIPTTTKLDDSHSNKNISDSTPVEVPPQLSCSEAEVEIETVESDKTKAIDSNLVKTNIRSVDDDDKTQAVVKRKKPSTAISQVTKRQKSNEPDQQQPTTSQNIAAVLENLSDGDASLVILSESLNTSQFPIDNKRKVSPLFTSAQLDMSTVMTPVDLSTRKVSNQVAQTIISHDDSSDMVVVKPKESQDGIKKKDLITTSSQDRSSQTPERRTKLSQGCQTPDIVRNKRNEELPATPPRQIIGSHSPSSLKRSRNKKITSPGNEKTPTSAMKLRRRDLLLKKSDAFISDLRNDKTLITKVVSARDWVGCTIPCTITTVGDLCSLQPSEARQYLLAPDSVRKTLTRNLLKQNKNKSPEKIKAKENTPKEVVEQKDFSQKGKAKRRILSGETSSPKQHPSEELDKTHEKGSPQKTGAEADQNLNCEIAEQQHDSTKQHQQGADVKAEDKLPLRRKLKIRPVLKSKVAAAAAATTSDPTTDIKDVLLLSPNHQKSKADDSDGWDLKVTNLLKRFKSDLINISSSAPSSDDKLNLYSKLCCEAEEHLCKITESKSGLRSLSPKGVLKLSDSQEV